MNEPPILTEQQTPHCVDGADIEIITSREVPLGGLRAMSVYRTLPQRQRSLIGAWCFVDHYGPDNVADTGGMDVAPHPHSGLQTVSWLFEGNITHHDSGGNHAVVKPGEANFMTAGNGICHSEVSTQDTTILHGVQLWVALPDSARHGQRRFDHYVPPVIEVDGGQIRTFVGELAGSVSPVPTFTPLLGAEIRINPHSTVVLDINPDYEHGLLVDSGNVDVEGTKVERTELAYSGIGQNRLRIRNSSDEIARTVLIGGQPFTEQIVMWWNFIARDSAELNQMRQAWEEHSERYGKTEGYIGHDPQGLSRIPAPVLPDVTIRPRKNPQPVARPDVRF
ncbi:pirin family protein [Arcanobacterium pinnipediorum]|uniref:Pirin family protein n=1 Tax=Arcanobacterium pinnipediorum TaxID=1503041 RepID=A0ABY5AGN5_9ACTO|nr:pirin family protein [Arcanobacterium pinnipediorum]USR78881.1 pirin family protein [Arcanobacterium pinnipediorum]